MAAKFGCIGRGGVASPPVTECKSSHMTGQRTRPKRCDAAFATPRPVSDVIGTVDSATPNQSLAFMLYPVIERIVNAAVTDPVGPEYMAPLQRG
jgi:hypothetical protein